METDTRYANVLDAPGCDRSTEVSPGVRENYIGQSFRTTTTFGQQSYQEPVFQLFFSDQNIGFLMNQIDTVLKELTKENVGVDWPTQFEEFTQTMIDMANRNPALAQVPDGLSTLNRAVIQHEANVQYISLRRRKLFYKYFIDQDRKRTMDYGVSTKGMRGETLIESSGYALSHPWKKYRNCYLKETHALVPTGTNSNGNTTFCRIPGYRQPKVAPPNRPPYTLSTVGPTASDCQQFAVDATQASLGQGTFNYPVDRGARAWNTEPHADLLYPCDPSIGGYGVNA